MGSGYSVYVYYRASSGDAWSLYGLAPGTVNVTAGALSTITVDQPPAGTTSRTQAQALTVHWTTNANVSAPAQFSIWVVSPGNSWYVGQVKAADGTAAYSDSVALERPARGQRLQRLRLLPRHQRRPLEPLRPRPGHGERNWTLTLG